MRILVCGSRTRGGVKDIITLREVFRFYETVSLVIEGCAKGADRAAELAAKFEGITVQHMPADWSRLGRRAGYVRNAEMVREDPDLCIALWDGESKGTAHTIRLCEDAGIEVLVV